MLEILLIRHGQTDWNRDKRIMGHRPIPLNAVGRREAMAIAKALEGVPLHGIYSSPYLRAVQTARHISKRCKTPVKLMPDVAEIDYGQWVGKTFSEVSVEKSFHVYHTTPKLAQAPGGEKMTQVQKRAVRFIETLKKKHAKGGRVVVVSHADVIKAILVHYLGLDLNELLRLRIDNASLSLLWLNETRSRVMAINCPHSPTKLFSGAEK